MDTNSFCVFATLLIATPVAMGAVHLRPVSVIYIPYSYPGSVPSYGIDMAAVEQSAYDVIDRIMYAAGKCSSNNFSVRLRGVALERHEPFGETMCSMSFLNNCACRTGWLWGMGRTFTQ